MKLMSALKLKTLARLVAQFHPRAHQTPNKTGLNRYPEIFVAAAAVVPEARNVLSFGCSTGEECATLAGYFPHAQIVGTDINPANLLKARWNFRSPRIKFIYANDRRLARVGPFDAIFCMAVLRVPRRDQPQNIAQIYPLARFEDRVIFLDSVLRAGGLFVIHNALYRLADTPVAPRYQAVPIGGGFERDDVIYGPDGEREPRGGVRRRNLPQAALTRAASRLRADPTHRCRLYLGRSQRDG